MLATLATLLLFFFIGVSNFRPIDNTDIWFHLKTGEIVAREHFIPIKDIFSHTVPDHRWVAQSWLYDVFIFYIKSIFSWDGIVVFKVLISFLTYGLLFKILRKKGLSILWTVFLLLIMQLCMVELWVDRPHILGYLLIAATYYLLEKFVENRIKTKLLFFVFAFVFWLWGNLHSSVIVGLLLIGVYWVSSLVNAVLESNKKSKLTLSIVKNIVFKKNSLQFLKLGFISFGASILNPNLFYQHLYVLIVSLPYQKKILYEWKPLLTYISDWHVQLFLFFIILASASIILYIVWLKEKLDIKTYLLFPLLFYFAFDALRNIGNFFVLFLPVYTPVLIKLRARITHTGIVLYGRTLLFGLLTFSLVSWSGIKTPFIRTMNTPKSGVYSQRLPVAAADYLEEKKGIFDEKIYDPYHWGGYLLWRLYPDYKVFVDSRWDPYLKAVFEDYYNIAQGQVDFDKVLDKYQVDIVILQDSEDWARWELIGSRLELSGNWYVVFKDDLSTIFLRDKQEYQEIIEKEAYKGAIFYGEEIITREGKLKQAKEDLERIIEVSPDFSSFAYNRLGVIAANEGGWDRALSYYQKALEVNPKYASAVFNIGRLYELRDNDYEKALSYYQKSVGLDKKFLLGYIRIGDVYFNKFGFNDKALENYEIARKLAADPAVRNQIDEKIFGVKNNIKGL